MMKSYARLRLLFLIVIVHFLTMTVDCVEIQSSTTRGEYNPSILARPTRLFLSAVLAAVICIMSMDILWSSATSHAHSPTETCTCSSFRVRILIFDCSRRLENHHRQEVGPSSILDAGGERGLLRRRGSVSGGHGSHVGADLDGGGSHVDFEKEQERAGEVGRWS